MLGTMKRIALLLVLGATACSMSNKGARGPVIHRTTQEQVDQNVPEAKASVLDARADLGQL